MKIHQESRKRSIAATYVYPLVFHFLLCLFLLLVVGTAGDIVPNLNVTADQQVIILLFVLSILSSFRQNFLFGWMSPIIYIWTLLLLLLVNVRDIYPCYRAGKPKCTCANECDKQYTKPNTESLAMTKTPVISSVLYYSFFGRVISRF